MKTKYICSAVLTLVSLAANAQWGVDTSNTNFAPTTKVSFSETSLPLVFINVDGQTIQKDDRILAKMKIISNADGHNYTDTVANPNQTVDYEGYIALKYRGNSSFYNSKKKPFSVRPLATADVSGKKQKVVLLGMGKKGDNDWCLLAPWEDRSYVRDLLTFELARNYIDYSPRGRYCEVILDGVYYGVYILTERPTKGKDRLNLDDPGDYAGDLSGDYHVCVDRTDEDHYYQSKYHPLDGSGNELTGKYITFQYKDFEYDDFMDADFLAKYPHAIDSLHHEIDVMEDALKSDGYADADTGYRAYIDPLSFIDYQLATELSNNIDGYRLSTNLYKYSKAHAAEKSLDPRWKMTLWDFNIAYGNVSYYNPTSSTWRYKANSIMANADAQLVPFWWERLMSDPQYVSELKARWAEYRQGSYTKANIEAKIDSMVSVLKASGGLDRDNQAWSWQFGSIDSNVSTLKSFLDSRLAFLDAQLGYSESGGDDGGDDDNGTEPVAIKSGFNLDVICEDADNVSGTITTSDVSKYQGLDKASFVFYTSNVRSEGALCGTDGKFASTSANYCAPVGKENALVLKDITGGASEGELVLETPSATDRIYLIGTCGDGTSTLSVTLNYADGTHADAAIFSLSDWATQNGAVSGLGRMVTVASSWAGSVGTISNSCNFNLFETAVAADSSKQVTSISVKRTGSNCPSVLGVSMHKCDGSGIGTVPTAAQRYIVAVYSLDGIDQPALQPGINIVKYSDGCVEKVLVK